MSNRINADQASKRSNAVKMAEEYYDSSEADSFYKTIWGGQDIHIGLYRGNGESIAEASRRTVRTMADRLDDIDGDTRVIDLGAGYGGAGRYLAEEFDCQVTCLNLSETQNALNRKLTEKADLTENIDVVHGNFENVPDPDDSYDVVWSQDAFLHSGSRESVLDEAARVLKPGGQLIFTDPMQADDCPDGVLQPILDRIKLETLGSPEFYREELQKRGFEEEEFEPMTGHLQTHYARVRETLIDHYDEAVERSGKTYVDNMIKGLQHWVDGADRGYLKWGIMRFRFQN